MFNPHTRKESSKWPPEENEAPECKTDNGENARMHETNTYAKAMHTMAWYEMHDMDKMQNEEKTQPRGNIIT